MAQRLLTVLHSINSQKKRYASVPLILATKFGRPGREGHRAI